jgi:hypothetical protein
MMSCVSCSWPAVSWNMRRCIASPAPQLDSRYCLSFSGRTRRVGSFCRGISATTGRILRVCFRRRAVDRRAREGSRSPVSLSAQKMRVKESTSLTEGAHGNGRSERQSGAHVRAGNRAARGLSEALIRSHKHLTIAVGACVTGSVSRPTAGHRPAAASPSWAEIIVRPNDEIASRSPLLLCALSAKTTCWEEPAT